MVKHERQRRYYQNRKQGLRWYNLCLPDYLVELALVDAGLLTKADCDDGDKVRSALQAHLTDKLKRQYPEMRGGNYDKPDDDYYA
jgi:hypothetical protein